MRRSISSIALLFASVSAILGSGWLFTAYYTSILAGPSTLLSWLVGGGVIALIAFTFAELSAMIPITGSSSRIPLYTHGTIVSFLFAWIIWLSYASLAPTEVQAVIQYLSYFSPAITEPKTGALTQLGFLLATLLMMIISAINAFSLRWLMRCNNILTVLKLLIPLIISVTILALFFKQSVHGLATLKKDFTPFFPMGYHGLFAAITAGGIVFAFNGFKQACEMAGEAKNPKRSLPIAIIGSIILCLVLYLLLQLSFLISIREDFSFHGWAQLNLIGRNSPFAAILAAKNLPWMLTLLYLGAVIGPMAAGLMYMGSAARSLYAMSKNDYIPLMFQHLTAHGNPMIAISANLVIGMLMFLPLPGWDKMVTFLTSLMALTYAIAPVCLLSLRYQAPNQERPFKLPFVHLWSWFAFYSCTLFAYWSGWDIISKLGIALLLALLVLFAYHFGTARGRELKIHWRPAIWVWPYFTGLSLISYLGNFGNGLGIINFGWDFFIIAIFCLFTLYLSQKYKLPASETQAYLEKAILEHEPEPETPRIRNTHHEN